MNGAVAGDRIRHGQGRREAAVRPASAHVGAQGLDAGNGRAAIGAESGPGHAPRLPVAIALSRMARWEMVLIARHRDPTRQARRRLHATQLQLDRRGSAGGDHPAATGASSGSAAGTRPIAWATCCTLAARSAKFSMVKLWAPSHRAVSGAGCTSMSRPSAPAATAAIGLTQMPLAGSVTGINDDGQVAQALGDGNGAHVEGIAGVGLEALDPALAEHHLHVSLGPSRARRPESTRQPSSQDRA